MIIGLVCNLWLVGSGPCGHAPTPHRYGRAAREWRIAPSGKATIHRIAGAEGVKTPFSDSRFNRRQSAAHRDATEVSVPAVR